MDFDIRNSAGIVVGPGRHIMLRPIVAETASDAVESGEAEREEQRIVKEPVQLELPFDSTKCEQVKGKST
jgi:hypothetical protein